MLMVLGLMFGTISISVIALTSTIPVLLGIIVATAATVLAALAVALGIFVL